MILPITWNLQFEQWEVKDETGKPLWRGNSYSDAVQFADDYMKQAAILKGLQEK